MRVNRSTIGRSWKASPVLLGAAGVACFSMTFPATTAAERAFGPVLVGAGRAVPAAALGAAVLLARRERLLPPRAARPQFIVVALTVGVGFGVLSAVALAHVSTVHGAVLTGLIPAATAGVAVLRAGERPRPAYWAVLALGLAVVIGFALAQGGGRLRPADLFLLAGMAVGGVGYTEGGILARRYGGWRVICWALIVALPVSLPLTAWAAVAEPVRHVSAGAVAGLAWVCVVSMLLGFFAWYAGLARGGVARVGRLQLAQPALTLIWSALLLGEHVSLLTGLAAAAVIAVTAAGRNAGLAPAGGPGGPGRVMVTPCRLPRRSSRSAARPWPSPTPARSTSPRPGTPSWTSSATT
jgi:drug/metabolite transporter (DMT)-like permease